MTSIGDRGARRLAWVAFAADVFLVAGALGLGLVTRSPSGAPRPVGDFAFGLLSLAFPVVGVVILARQPRNAIGWILIAIGLAWAVSAFGVYGEFALQHGLPGASLALAVTLGSWAPPIGLIGTVLLLRFPNGRLLSSRWRTVEWLALISIGAIVALIDLAPDSMREAGYPGVRNPLGVEALRSAGWLLGPVLLIFSVTLMASAVSLVVRFRRSRGVERLQLKWLTTAAAAVGTLFLLGMLRSVLVTGRQSDPAWAKVLDASTLILFMLIPMAIGFAVLRYRLYDIDRVVNRTLVYLVLTVVLGVVYASVTFVPVLVVGAGRETPPAVVAVATLVVAALFGPTRRRVQSFIDRRFYRRRYDAQRALASFSAELREETDLDALRRELLRTVDETVQPRNAFVWLRPEQVG